MISASPPSDFATRCSQALSALGADSIPAWQSIVASPPWTEGWSNFWLLNEPGALTVYALIDGQGLDLAQFRSKYDALAAGVAGSGLMEAPSLTLVAVVTLSSPSRSMASAVARSVPSQYYPRLRPHAIAVDTDSGQIFASSTKRKPEGYSALKSAAAGEAVSGAGRASLQDFYHLTQRRKPYATYALVALNVCVFFLVSLAGGLDSTPQGYANAVRFGALFPRLVEHGEVWRLVTVMFLHANITHLIFNMTSLFAVGILAERLYGTFNFSLIYLGSGLVGAVTSLGFAVVTNQLDNYGVGASGAIFGIAGALLSVRFQKSEIIPVRLRERVTSSMVPLVAISLLLSQFVTPNVDSSAHLGGLIGGIALSFVFPLARRTRRNAST